MKKLKLILTVFFMIIFITLVSYAQVVKCDLDSNGEVNNNDKKLMKEFLVKIHEFSDEEKVMMDFNDDDNITATDLSLFKEQIKNQKYPEKVNLNYTNIEVDLKKCSTIQLEVEIYPFDSNVKNEISWQSSDVSIATVSKEGLVTLLSDGNVIISAETENGIKAACEIKVTNIQDSELKKAQKIVLSDTYIKLNLNGNISGIITATLEPYGENQVEEILWKSSNPNVVTITNTGRIKAISEGRAIITAYTNEGLSADCIVDVEKTEEKIIPEAIFLNETEILLNLSDNKAKQLTVSYEPTNCNYYRKLEWISSDENIVKVNFNGLVTAVGEGIAIVTARTENGKIASCRINVKEPKVEIVPTSVSLNKNSVELDLKGNLSYQFSANVYPTNANKYCKLTWESSDTNVININSTGKVTAVGEGEAIITVSTENNKKATAKVIVKRSFSNNDMPVVPIMVLLDKNEITLDLFGNKEETLYAAIVPEKATMFRNLYWESSNEKVATINDSGKVVAVGIGKATITVRTDNNVSGICTVNVVDTRVDAEELELNIINDTINVKGTNQIILEEIIRPTNANNFTKINWTSSNPNVAAVSSWGCVTAISPGNAIITAETENGLKATCNVDVVDEDILIDPVSISIDRNYMTLNLNGTSEDMLTAQVTPKKANQNKSVIWLSSNEDVATVSIGGKVKARTPGRATIIALSGKDCTLQSTCEILVTDDILIPPTSIQLNETDLKLDINGTKESKLFATILPRTANTNTDITWESTDERIATVSSTGVVRAVSKGKTIIVAKNANGLEAKCSVTVEESTASIEPENIIIINDSINLNLNGTKSKNITYRILPENANKNTNVYWTVEDMSIATVNSSGEVFAVSEGTTKLIATTENGVRAEKIITVESSTVYIEPENITLSETVCNLDLNSNNTIELTANITPNNTNKNDNIIWSTNNPEVAIVSRTGKVTAVGEGEALIVAKTGNEKQAICQIVVTKTEENFIEPENITLNTNSKTLDLNGTKSFLLYASIFPSNANKNTAITWSMSKPGIVTVSNSGLVTAIAEGEVDVIATTKNGKTATCKVNVIKSQTKIEPESISIEEYVTLDLNGTKTRTLYGSISPTNANTNTSITWRSSNTNVVAVSSTGKITGLQEGNAVITATTANGKSDTCIVNVIKTEEIIEPTAIAVKPTTINLDLKDVNTAKIDALISPSNANYNTGVNWSSSDTQVVIVSSSGYITAIQEGTATITARTANGMTASCTVNVSDSTPEETLIEPTSISVTPDTLSLDLNETKTASLVTSILPAEANYKTSVSFTSSNSNIVAVNSYGTVTALQKGTATITARTANGKTAICTVTVENSGEEIPKPVVTLSKTQINVEEGQSDSLKINIQGQYTNIKVQVENSNSSVCSVTSTSDILNYSIKGLSAGNAQIKFKITLNEDINYELSTSVTVNKKIVPVSGISLSRTSVKMEIKSSTTIQANISPTSATNKNVKWEITDTKNILDCEANGSSLKITSKSTTGTAKIKAISLDGNYSASCDVTVTPMEVGNVTRNVMGTKLTMPEGDKFYFLQTDDSANNRYSDCILIESEGKFGLVDLYRSGYYSTVKSFLSKLNVKQLEFVLITHEHGDHRGNFKSLLEDFKVKTLYIKDGRKNNAESSKYIADINAAKNKNMPLSYVSEDKNKSFAFGNLTFNLYNRALIPTEKSGHENANSLVALVTSYGGKTVYLSGDIQKSTVNGTTYNRGLKVAKEIGKKVNVYKVAHHGQSDKNNSQDELDILKPDYAIMTIDATQSVTSGRLKKANSNVKLYRTGVKYSGTVVVNIDPNGKISVKTTK